MTTRTLTLIRHAKSSWNDPVLSDFDRPLNKRGREDAPRVAKALQKAGLSFDKILCSDAARARETLSLLMPTMGLSESIVSYQHDLYGATAGFLLSSMLEQDNAIHHLALVGHNPGMEDLANHLADKAIGSMSTCCVCHLVFDFPAWNELADKKGKLVLEIRPRDL